MENYSTIPSFTASSASNAKDYEMKYNMNTGDFELTLEDGNNTLKYFDFSASGVNVQRNGNMLILSAPTEKQFNTITVKANKNLPKDVLPSLISGTPEFWLNPTQQNFTSLDVSDSREAVTAYFKLHTEKIGHIKLKKTSEDGVVANLKFKISGNGIDRIYTTDKDGNIPINNLIAGEYIITEVDTPNKYVQPQTQVVYVKPAQTTAVDFSNILKKFNINITKADEETGSNPQGDATLDGAEYDIYDSQGNLVDHMKADGQTATSKLLVLGTYKLYEVVPPKGYTLNNEHIIVTGDFEGQTVEIGRADTGITDRVIKGQVAVTKFADKPLTGSSEDGGVKQPLEGIEFTLTLKSTGVEACKITTDADGTVDADTITDTTAFLETFFKLYPTATEKELAYYVQGNALEVINGDYLYSEFINSVFTQDGENVKVSVSVKYIDNQTKAMQVSQYELTLQKGDNWKIVQ